MSGNPTTAMFGEREQGRTAMKPLTKVGLVAGGYLLALAVAAAVVAARIFLTSGPPGQEDGGMQAFGDLLLFLGVFELAAVPPTGAALVMLRPYPIFWRGLCAVALVVSLTLVVAGIAFAIDSPSLPRGVVFPRILLAPMFTLGFFVAGITAPQRWARMILFSTMLLEAMIFTGWILACLLRVL